MKNVKKVYAIAFRNGTESVSTAVSSVHRDHNWEGVTLNPKELRNNEDNDKLNPFERVTSHVFKNAETEEERESI